MSFDQNQRVSIGSHLLPDISGLKRRSHDDNRNAHQREPHCKIPVEHLNIRSTQIVGAKNVTI